MNIAVVKLARAACACVCRIHPPLRPLFNVNIKPTVLQQAECGYLTLPIAITYAVQDCPPWQRRYPLHMDVPADKPVKSAHTCMCYTHFLLLTLIQC